MLRGPISAVTMAREDRVMKENRSSRRPVTPGNMVLLCRSPASQTAIPPFSPMPATRVVIARPENSHCRVRLGIHRA